MWRRFTSPPPMQLSNLVQLLRLPRLPTILLLFRGFWVGLFRPRGCLQPGGSSFVESGNKELSRKEVKKVPYVTGEAGVRDVAVGAGGASAGALGGPGGVVGAEGGRERGGHGGCGASLPDQSAAARPAPSPAAQRHRWA